MAKIHQRILVLQDRKFLPVAELTTELKPDGVWRVVSAPQSLIHLRGKSEAEAIAESEAPYSFTKSAPKPTPANSLVGNRERELLRKWSRQRTGNHRLARA